MVEIGYMVFEISQLVIFNPESVFQVLFLTLQAH
jgi:hypothetical protein